MRQFFSLKYIFLTDGIGAAISAMLLLLLLAPFESFFGFPANVAISLSILPIVFSFYSLSCYWLKPESPIYLKFIATANLMYCFITIFLVIYYFPKITIFGVAYFLIEKMIVIPLAVWEWKLGSSKSLRK